MSVSYSKSHERLDVWNRAMDLVDAVYSCVSRFPPEERFNLADQMRRSACSIPSNIAEGAARETPRENLRALYYARGSLAELETQLEIARRRNYDVDDIQACIDRVSQLLNGYMRSVCRRLR